MVFSLVSKFLLCCILLSSYAWAENIISVKHYQQQERYEFGLMVLDLALSKLGEDYQVIGPEFQEVNEDRGELLVIEGMLDLEFMSTTLLRESKMIPVKIPVYQGLLGLRLLLIKPELNPIMKQIDSIEGLRQFVGGHGSHWGDLPVYAANNLKVVTATQYANLFEMLKLNRFDYFHRGVNEIWNELERYHDDFVVADNIMLYYPQPVYFFVGKHRPILAEKIERGLRLALADGSYKALFQDYYQYSLDQANIQERKIFILKNPSVPPDTPKIHIDLWMPADKLTHEYSLSDPTIPDSGLM
ncbi:MAG: hypothetical protein ACI8O8_001584 [Oleiphilaceae bacterium]|jgi:hypothetical protein